MAKPTMGDVAKRAGVSPATVARVIYANGYVTKEKRAIVEAAVEAIGYRPNVTARALRTSKSFTIGLVVSENARNPFFTHVADVIQIEALRQGYTVLTLNNNASYRAEREGVQRFLDQHVDAVIFCAALDPTNVRMVAKSGIPFVQVEREIATIGRKITVDSAAGFREAADHLKALGHRSVSYIGAKPGIDRSELAPELSVEALRLRGFRDAFLGAGLTILAEILRDSYYNKEGEQLQGNLAMAQLLAGPQRPTAVVCSSDILAAGALQAIHRAGLTVPRDISLIGFDDSFAEMMTPPLTTVAQPIAELGVRAIRLALDGIENDDNPSSIDVLQTSLVVRESTAAAPDVR